MGLQVAPTLGGTGVLAHRRAASWVSVPVGRLDRGPGDRHRLRAAEPARPASESPLRQQRVVRGEGVAISPRTVQRILARHHLKPWRCVSWIHPATPASSTRPVDH